MMIKTHAQDVNEFNDFNDFEFQLVIEALITDDRSIDEGLFDKFKTQIDFIKNIAAVLKLGFKDLLKMFKNSKIVKFFKAIKWSFKKLFELLKSGYKAYQKLTKVIFEYLADNKVAKWTQSKLGELDDFLQKHPLIKRLGGLAVSGILIYIWLNMSFTGDVGYDFGFGDIINALLGKFTLATIFAGPEGIKLLTLFATGALFGLSFPWIGPTSIQLIGGVLKSLNDKFKIIKLPKKMTEDMSIVQVSIVREALVRIQYKV